MVDKVVMGQVSVPILMFPLVIFPIFKGQEVEEFFDFLTLEDWTDMWDRNVGKGLPLDAAQYRRRGQISKHATGYFTSVSRLLSC
jgi:hypothetical protein